LPFGNPLYKFITKKELYQAVIFSLLSSRTSMPFLFKRLMCATGATWSGLSAAHFRQVINRKQKSTPFTKLIFYIFIP